MTRPTLKSLREWSVGIASLPAFVNENPDAPYCPDMLIWVDENGLIVGSELVPPGEALNAAAASLAKTARDPQAGRPRKPTHVRSNSAALLDALRPHFPDITFVPGRTPQFDEAAHAVQEHFRNLEAEEGESPWLTGDLDADTIARFHRAAAALYRSKPWDKVPSDTDLFLTDIPALDLHQAAVTVIGQAGESFGIVVFPGGITDFDDYMLAATSFMPGGPRLELPFHFSLNFERGADLPPHERKEVLEHRWEVADVNAYPSVMVVAPSLIRRPPTRRELLILEILAHALPQALGSHLDELLDAWESDEPVARKTEIVLAGTTYGVALRTATEADLPDDGDILDLLDALHDAWLDEIEEGADSAEREEMMAVFLDAFAQSEEAAACSPLKWTRVVMELAFYQQGLSLASMTGPRLRELLFGILPRKVMAPPQSAGSLVGELRALFAFLERTTDLRSASACLKVLNKSAEGKLRDALTGAAPAARTASREPSVRQALARIEKALAEPPAKNTESKSGKPKPPRKK